jgi:hypothetical protein
VDYRTLFSSVHRRPEMHGVPNTFPGLCAFVAGVDAGNEWQFLVGFREFLVVRADKGANLSWPGLVRHIAFPGKDHLPADQLADPNREQHAIDTLFALLDEFLERRARHAEPATIFAEYAAWRQVNGLT